jgi:hypothetical protein
MLCFVLVKRRTEPSFARGSETSEMKQSTIISKTLVLHATGFEPVMSLQKQIMSLLLSTTQPHMLN